MTDEVRHDHRLRACCNGCRAEVDALERKAMKRYRELYRQPSLPPSHKAVSGPSAAPVFGDSSPLTSEYAGRPTGPTSPKATRCISGSWRSLLSPKTVLEVLATPLYLKVVVILLAVNLLVLAAVFVAR